MASSSIPTGVAVKFWVPNMGAHVPVSLTTGLPEYAEYVRSGLWLPRRRLRICGGSGEVAYLPEGDRSWPSTFPVQNLKVYDICCEMQGVSPEKAINPISALEVLEGQVALVSWPSRRPTQLFMSYHLARNGRPISWHTSWEPCQKDSWRS